jgi:L-threonylcarbamoyladenylate synthase
LGTQVACILEGGPCTVGIESTIVDLSQGQACILRPGMITAAQIEAVIQQPLQPRQEKAPRVPGMHLLHYAPKTRLVLVPPADISSFWTTLNATELPLAFLGRQTPRLEKEGVQWIQMPQDPQQYAQDLYTTLRFLDKQQFKKIAVEAVPLEEEWLGVKDRLERARHL